MNDSDMKKSAKPSKNRAWGLQGIDEYTIAYVHIIVCFIYAHLLPTIDETPVDIPYTQSCLTMDTSDRRYGPQ